MLQEYLLGTAETSLLAQIQQNWQQASNSSWRIVELCENDMLYVAYWSCCASLFASHTVWPGHSIGALPKQTLPL